MRAENDYVIVEGHMLLEMSSIYQLFSFIFFTTGRYDICLKYRRKRNYGFDDEPRYFTVFYYIFSPYLYLSAKSEFSKETFKIMILENLLQLSYFYEVSKKMNLNFNYYDI